MDKPPPSTTLVSELEPIIKQFILLRRYIDSEKEKLTVLLSEYEKNKNLLQTYLGATLNQNHLDSVSTSIGTAFTSVRVEYRVADKTSLLKWLFMQNDPDVWELFDLKPNAKEVDNWASRRLQDHVDAVATGKMTAVFENYIPPGLSRSATTTVKVRKKGSITDD